MNPSNPANPTNRSGTYWPPFWVVTGAALVFSFVVPKSLWAQASVGGLILAALIGGFVGCVEVANRYHDEPFRACRSPFGLIYIVANAVLSLGAALMIYHYRTTFPSLAGDPLGVAIAAGFGAAAVMRSKVVTLQGSDKSDIVIGPDAFVQAALKTIDHQVDRFRAAHRVEIAMQALPTIRGIGSFSEAAKYLSASLLAFQNLDPSLKEALSALVTAYEAESTLPDDLKKLGLAFMFLTIVGESQFQAVLEKAKEVKLGPQTP